MLSNTMFLERTVNGQPGLVAQQTPALDGGLTRGARQRSPNATIVSIADSAVAPEMAGAALRGTGHLRG